MLYDRFNSKQSLIKNSRKSTQQLKNTNTVNCNISNSLTSQPNTSKNSNQAIHMKNINNNYNLKLQQDSMIDYDNSSTLNNKNDIEANEDDSVPNIRFTILDDLDQLNQNINGKQQASLDMNNNINQNNIYQYQNKNQFNQYHHQYQNLSNFSNLSSSKKRINALANISQTQNINNKENSQSNSLTSTILNANNNQSQPKQSPFTNSRKAKVSSSNKYLKSNKNQCPMSPLSPVSPINPRNNTKIDPNKANNNNNQSVNANILTNINKAQKNQKKSIQNTHKNISSPVPKTILSVSSKNKQVSSNININNNVNLNNKFESHKTLFEQIQTIDNKQKRKKIQKSLMNSINNIGFTYGPIIKTYTKTINLMEDVEIDYQNIVNDENVYFGNTLKMNMNLNSGNKKHIESQKKQHNLFSKAIQSDRLNKGKKGSKLNQKK